MVNAGANPAVLKAPRAAPITKRSSKRRSTSQTSPTRAQGLTGCHRPLLSTKHQPTSHCRLILRHDFTLPLTPGKIALTVKVESQKDLIAALTLEDSSLKSKTANQPCQDQESGGGMGRIGILSRENGREGGHGSAGGMTEGPGKGNNRQRTASG